MTVVATDANRASVAPAAGGRESERSSGIDVARTTRNRSRAPWDIVNLVTSSPLDDYRPTRIAAVGRLERRTFVRSAAW
ncbi:MAG TPA: hypothetical protein DCQ98_12445 [Planctomycetaceae bacterium]|nr:hypothetical protein [Planctomycetaceae bacterium]